MSLHYYRSIQRGLDTSRPLWPSGPDPTFSFFLNYKFEGEPDRSQF